MSRVYHFAPKEHGLSNIQKRSLKVDTFDKMNDPFELLGVHLGDRSARRKFRQWRLSIAKEWGVLCFTMDWRSPLLWSHYADSHKGICLGFDVPEEKLRPVKYQQHRSLTLEGVDCHCISPLLWTKFTNWKYENEQRKIVPLQECHSENKLFFWPFGEDLKLREIVVGARCKLGGAKIKDNLGDMRDCVKLTKAREALKTFHIVTQRRGLPD